MLNYEESNLLTDRIVIKTKVSVEAQCNILTVLYTFFTISLLAHLTM